MRAGRPWPGLTLLLALLALAPATRAVCEDNREQVWVCHYRPAGNVVGQRPY